MLCPCPQLHQPPLHSVVNAYQIPQKPSITPTSHNFPQYPDITDHNQPPLHGFMAVQPPQSLHPPPWGNFDPSGQSQKYNTNFHTGNHLQQQFGHQLPMDRPAYSPLSGPHPTSCWYPSFERQPRGHPSHEQHRGVRLDPPRFDGTDTTNWIFKIQYYFDHMMMSDSNKLHYVVPLFDPPASEWIKHYCSNNDYVTWQEFLNEVRYRCDPDCYESYIGLISKLCQTGTVSEYQFEFEKLQNKLSGVPDYILLPIYVAGLKQPLQREVKLH